MTNITLATHNYLDAIADARLTLREFVKETSYQFVTAKLEACDGNQCHAARELGVHRNTLARILTEMERAGRGRSSSLRGRPGRRRKPVPQSPHIPDPESFARIAGMR